MSCWRVLQLSEEGTTVPQLLIKTHFGSSAYTVFLTDLTNIWSEELDLSGIVRRASEVESPIEVSERDTSQLAILFENVQKSLSNSHDATSAISRAKLDNVTLHTTISLPEPLDSLAWKFHLVKGTAAALKNELILPLLISSHVQHVRISRLLSVISDKDRAITRLVDQYESSNLDLAAAFPSIGNAKSGKKVVRREQAARHIPGLQNFEPDTWKRETAEMDTSVSTLGLFQEALSECTPSIPPKLKSSDDEEAHWWNDLESSAVVSKRVATTRASTQPKRTTLPAPVTAPDSETEDEETEDEFETHENFKSRDLTKKLETPAIRAPALDKAPREDGNTVDDAMEVDQEDEDDEDLDAPPKVHSQGQRSPWRRKASSPKAPTPKVTSPVREDSPPATSQAKGFKIGGRFKKTESPPAVSEGETSISQLQNEAIPTRSKIDEGGVDKKPVKKGFKIGGRAKSQTPMGIEEPASSGWSRARRDTSVITQRPSAEPSVSIATKAEEQALPVEEEREEREETEEEKVERKRRELKRKNEELARKQAQSKKKKRF
ncbi:XLF-domain-containing protein [Karstenula rhodostoma CBS 690.94]|uniref:Non-homologous end-joining factor 1 n=1 Tax=Karstenula rhodostoma CBS 690.94 TaxID=1392251 RepID=A0A9P4U6B5_9PLEO|nr:XLF-domain-containing protein [Karstenula rhodostoma CBS 690.94]